MRRKGPLFAAIAHNFDNLISSIRTHREKYKTHILSSWNVCISGKSLHSSGGMVVREELYTCHSYNFSLREAAKNVYFLMTVPLKRGGGKGRVIKES